MRVRRNSAIRCNAIGCGAIRGNAVGCDATGTPAPARRGVVLIVVLVLVVMVALAGFGFLAAMSTEYEAAKINGDLLQAQQAMASAETLLLAMAEKPAQQSDLRTELRTGFQTSATASAADTSPLLRSHIVRAINPLSLQPDSTAFDEGRADDWRFVVVKSLPERSMRDDGNDLFHEPQPLQFGLHDESAKLHLGRLLQWDEAIPGDGRTSLMQVPGMTEEAADSILDWIDADDEAREFGAEADYYQRLDKPYSPRNALPESLEELLFVKGVHRDAFYGTGFATDEMLDRRSLAWDQFLTLHSAERNADEHGQPRVNLNAGMATDLAGLEAELRSFLPEELARFIRLSRLHGTTHSTEPGISPLAANAGALTSPALFEITNLADLVDSSVRLPSSAGGDVVNSPLSSAGADFVETFRLLEDRTTLISTPVLSGRINVNEAPEPVLLALIADPATVSQVVQQRATLDPSELTSTAWLLSRRVMEMSTFRRIYPHITSSGDVRSGEVIVYREIGGPFLRRKVTIDAANDPPRRINWVDLTEHGLPLMP